MPSYKTPARNGWGFLFVPGKAESNSHIIFLLLNPEANALGAGR